MKKLIFNLIFLIPIINGIATSTTGFFPAVTFNPGTLRAFLIGIPLIFFIFRYYPVNHVNIIILLYSFYLLLLVFFSTDVLWSFYMYVKIVLGFLMFPLGYYFIKTRESFKKLMISFAITLLLLLINIFISNIFRLGSSDYLENSFYFGVGKVNVTTSILILVILAPVSLHLFSGRKRKMLIILFIIGFLIALIGIKRSVLLTAISAPIVYGLFTQYKKRLIKSLLLITLLVGITLIVFPNYYNVFIARFTARQEAGNIELSEETLNNQARFFEYNLVLETWIKGSLKHKLIGSDWLNDRAFFQSKRMLHTDYMVLLNGSGAIGFIMWFVVLIIIFIELKRYYKSLKHISFFNDIFAVSFCLLTAQFLMSISGTLYSIDVRCIFMLFWGSALGFLRHSVIELKAQGNQDHINQARLIR